MSYVIDIRRKLHKYPEIGLDLTKTLEIVRNQLSLMGIKYSEKYGKSSIVATINGEKKNFTIGIRADMDALPIAEKTNVSYKSKIKGQMHACGHDAHTAILLDTARRINLIKQNINCRVKLIFQPAEESSDSGAALMVKNGLMDDIDCIIALHCDPKYSCGKIGLLSGAQNAISTGFLLDFYGKSVHADLQEKGIDAIAMAVKAYSAIEIMIAKEISAKSPVIFNVGAFNGGKAPNIICDHSRLNCTVRAWDEDTAEYITERIKKIVRSVAKESGGKAAYTQNKYYPILCNNDTVLEGLRECAKMVVGPDNIITHQRSLGGEDFAYMVQKKPGAMFRLGIKNEELNCVYALHEDKFNIDERALSIGTEMFVKFVINYMDGIEF